MTREILLLALVLVGFTAQAGIQTGNEVLEMLNTFNPAMVLKDYQSSPKETTLNGRDKTILNTQAMDAFKKDETATFVRNQTNVRARFKANPKSAEMRYAETLLDDADGVLEGECYQTPPQCTHTSTVTRCEDHLNWQEELCGKTLNITFRPLTQTIERLVIGSSSDPATINLIHCDAYLPCTVYQRISLNEHCHHLSVSVVDAGVALRVIKLPNCQDPTIMVVIEGTGLYGEYIKTLAMTVTQWLPEDSWVQQDCNSFNEKSQNNRCLIETENTCTDSNQTRVIEGYPLKRPCWGIKNRYRCKGGITSTCTSLMVAGCSQTTSTCSHAIQGYCDTWQQTFQCNHQACLPQKVTCPGKITCADGSCDHSQSEKSDDMNEGLSKLAALTGAASEIAQSQDAINPTIFAGKVLSCKKTILNARDCCRDSGWGDWMLHCPASMQELIKARQENRVAYLGTYKKEFDKTHVYCVFPSVLASIVQKEGRLGQLHLSFGTPKAPDCRGITPLELTSIQFDALDLSPLTDSLRAKLTLPAVGPLQAKTEAQIQALHQKEQAHD